jgi:hypothetical protein
MQTLQHRAARGYAELGFPACPILGKAPVYAGGHGWNDATTVIDEQDALFETRPHTGVGIATGSRANALVLDIDGAPGRRSLIDLVQQNGDLPPTPVCVTGGGGYHLWFRWDDRCIPLRNRVCFAPGLDIRTGGGGVVVPPSIHPDTKCRYEWRVGRSPYEIEMPPIPEWLIDAITSSYPSKPTIEMDTPSTVVVSDRYTEAALKSAEDKIANCQASQRSTLWYEAVCIGKSLVATKRCKEIDAMRRLIAAGMQMENTKPRKWTKDEITAVVADGIDAGIRRATDAA